MNLISRFQLIFWGMLLAYLDFSLNKFDILPDVVGYALLILGCGGLAGESRGFTLAQWMAAVLGILSILPGWFVADHVREIGWAVDLFQVLLMWFLLGGIMKFASEREGADVARRASRLRKTYAVLTLLTAIHGIYADGNPNAVIAIAFGVMFLICIVSIMLLIRRLIQRIRHELAYHPEENIRVRTCWSAVALVWVLLIGTVSAVMVHQNSGYQSSTFSGANFHARDPDECAVTESNLREMLQTKGFSTSYTPTDMDRFAGIHGEGTRETWLKSDHEEFKGIYLKISSSERDIGISTKWEHNGFFRGADETYRRALNLSLVLARWLELRPERDDSLPNVSNSGIRFIEEELSKLPE